MSKVRFISDLHLGHNRIIEFSGKYRGNVTTTEEHDKWIVQQWNTVVSKNDTVMVLGDICFDRDKLHLFKYMKGNKHLILGNHDKFGLDEYAHFFSKIHGFTKYKGFWLSHSPIHPQELRGKFNIHGHVHQNIIQDPRYISVCVEALEGKPISFEEIQQLASQRETLLK